MIVLHTKSHSEPHKTNLANHARPGMEETRNSPAGNTPSRKRLMSPKAKGDSAKKPRLTKKQKQQKKDEEKGKEEKKKAIFGDWSEDEIEEIEEKEKLKESIANRESVEDSDHESIDDMFKFTDDHHSMDSDDDFPINTHDEDKAVSINQKPLRRRKADIKSFIKEQEQPKAKQKVYEKPAAGKPKVKTKPSAADAISSLIKSKLQGSEQTRSKRGKRSKKTTSKAKTSNKSEDALEANSEKDEKSLDVRKLLSETNLPSLPKLPQGKEKNPTDTAVPQPVDVFEENFSGSESAGTLGGSSAEEQEPASPPPTRKPGILRKSSHLSIQLPTRPNGNSVVIRHESNSPTKYAAISAKAKAKQLARSAQTEGNKNELASLNQQPKLISKADEHSADAMVESASSKPATLDEKEISIDGKKELVSGSAESASTNSIQPELPKAQAASTAASTLVSLSTGSPSKPAIVPTPSRTIVSPKKRIVSELEGGKSQSQTAPVSNAQQKGEPLKSPVQAQPAQGEEPLKESKKEKLTDDSGKEKLKESPKEEKKGKSPARKAETAKRKLEELAPKKTFEASLSHGNSVSRANTGEGETNLKEVLSESCSVVKIESVQNKISPPVEETINQQGPNLQRKDCSQKEAVPLQDLCSTRAVSDRKESSQSVGSASPKKPSTPQVIQLSSPNLDASSKNQVKLVSTPLLPKVSKVSGGQVMQSPNSKPTIITVGMSTAASPTKVPSSKPPMQAQKTALPPSSAVASKAVSGTAAKSSQQQQQQVRLVHNPVILPKATTATVFVQKPAGQQKIMPKTTGNQMIMPKPISRPVLLPKPASSGAKPIPGPVLLPKMSKPMGPTAMRSPNSKPTIITVGKTTALSPTKTAHTKPAVVQKPVLAGSPSKPMVMGPTSRLTSPSASLGLDKPVVAGVSKPALGGISLSKPPVVPLVSPHKEPAGEKGLTVSLEPKRSPVVEKSKAPVVKTVELPRRVVEASNRQQQKLPKPLTTTAVEVVQQPPAQPPPVEPTKEVSAASMLVEGAALGAEGLAALSQLQMQIGEEGGVGDGEMIYLLVDDGTDPNLALENQTLYIDPNQLAAATGGVLTLGSDLGSGHMIIQGNGSTGPLVLQASEGGSATEGQVLLMMPEMTAAAGMVGDVLPPLTSTLGLVTSADTSGGIATLPSHPSSSLLAQVNFLFQQTKPSL